MNEYEKIIEGFLEDMREVNASQEEFYQALMNAFSEIKIELQNCKETM
jgi:hypothetical protein